MKYPSFILTVIVLLTSLVAAQPRVVSVEELPLGTAGAWQNPQFSPTGTFVYFTSSGFRGIWRYSLQNRTVEQITEEPGAGYGFSISADETKIAYKATKLLPTRRREHTILLQDLQTRSTLTIDTGRRLSAPTFSGQGIRYTKGNRTEEYKMQTAGDNALTVAMEQSTLTLVKGSAKVVLDPFGNGRTIWPSLSPDKSLIVAYHMEQGTFVMDIDGNIQSRLGRLDAPTWTYDGKWIAYMDDRDDGHRILSSEIMLVSPDGKTTVALTDTPGTIELFPSCSPTEKKIAFHTQDGRIFVLTYTE